MSLKDKIKKRQQASAVFAVIAGERLQGKTTLVGTAPGRTLLLQAAVLETGSRSAEQLAAQKGYHLDVVDFHSLADLVDSMEEAATSDYDNIYIDGISAVTEMKLEEPEIQKLVKKDQWGAYREIGASVRNFIKLAKGLATNHGKNTFITLAFQPKRDVNGHLVELVPSCKGNVAVSEISRLCPVFVTLRTGYDENDQERREMVIKSDGVYPGRCDSLLDQDNPGVIEADLGVLLNLLKAD